MSKPALILIDIQRGFNDPIWGARNNPDAEVNAARLLNHWRANDAPIVHIQHLSVQPGSPLASDTPGSMFKPEVTPLETEQRFSKTVNSAFIGTGLGDYLRENEITDLVICGLTTPHCVSTTTRMAGNLGYSVTLAHDACAAFSSNAQTDWKEGLAPLDPQTVHDTAISHLHKEFAVARHTDAILKLVL